MLVSWDPYLQTCLWEFNLELDLGQIPSEIQTTPLILPCPLISPSRSMDLFRPSWPKGLTPGLWYLGHMMVKNPFLTKFWWLEASARNKWKPRYWCGFEQLLTDSSNHQNFVRNGFLASRWPENQNLWVKAFGHDGRNKSVLRLWLTTISVQNPFVSTKLPDDHNKWSRVQPVVDCEML